MIPAWNKLNWLTRNKNNCPAAGLLHRTNFGEGARQFCIWRECCQQAVVFPTGQNPAIRIDAEFFTRFTKFEREAFNRVLIYVKHNAGSRCNAPSIAQ